MIPQNQTPAAVTSTTNKLQLSRTLYFKTLRNHKLMKAFNPGTHSNVKHILN